MSLPKKKKTIFWFHEQLLNGRKNLSYLPQAIIHELLPKSEIAPIKQLSRMRNDNYNVTREKQTVHLNN